MRVDIREQTRSAARGELEHHGIGIALVSAELIEKSGGEWSVPLQMKLSVDEDGIVDIELRRAEEATAIVIDGEVVTRITAADLGARIRDELVKIGRREPSIFRGPA